MSDAMQTCPHCAEAVAPKAILCRFCDRGISKSYFKNCPSCAEMIWTDAVFCRYCRTPLMENRDVVEGWGEPKTDWPVENAFKSKPRTITRASLGIKLDDEQIEKIFRDNLKKKEK